ncbi:MAG: heme ABC transporter ATP-binding protein [Pseudomonadota bacterium]
MTLYAQDIYVSLGRKEILHGIDFDARPGAMTAIVGPNGSGKTTLMRALVGELPSSGPITLNGYAIRTAKPWQLAGIRGVLPQATSIAFPFTVIEVVSMGLEAGLHAADRSIPLSALAAVGLTGYEGRYYQELSGGEQQRAQLARVLSQVWEPVTEEGPSWLFLDEPVASLDIGHQLGVMQLAADYAARGGGVVAVMHDLNLTAMYADQITLIDNGRVRASGPPQQVLTDENLSKAYGCPVRVNTTPQRSGVFVLPHAAGERL